MHKHCTINCSFKYGFCILQANEIVQQNVYRSATSQNSVFKEIFTYTSQIQSSHIGNSSSCTDFISWVFFFLQAGLFMVFSITSAVFGGIILLFYSKEIASASCQWYYNYHYYNNYYYGYGHGKSTLPKRYPSYSYDAKMGLAALILTVGIIEFVTGFWLSVCIWVMIPSCTAGSEVSFSCHRFRVQG